jgi:hypothetical protein
MLSYYCIPVGLIYFLCKRRDLAPNRIFWMSSGFRLASGAAHRIEVRKRWNGSHLVGAIKPAKAPASLPHAVMLIPRISRLAALPSLRLAAPARRNYA